ncbi:MAG: hypothetical protein WDN72_10060 [Alphaproteobacteria bacterium]
MLLYPLLSVIPAGDHLPRLLLPPLQRDLPEAGDDGAGERAGLRRGAPHFPQPRRADARRHRRDVLRRLPITRRASLLLVAIEHALYGDFIFTVGLGHYFYEGAVHAVAVAH